MQNSRVHLSDLGAQQQMGYGHAECPVAGRFRLGGVQLMAGCEPVELVPDARGAT